jgi:nucleotide-binding universal stress UspA family protein
LGEFPEALLRKIVQLELFDTPSALLRGSSLYKRILDYVASEKIDLIIMGTGSPLQKAVFGSVADKVAKLSSVPVMLVKSN